MSDYAVKGGTLTCECGRKYHVSLFHEVLRVIAAAGYQRGQNPPPDPMQEAVEEGYAYGRELEAPGMTPAPPPGEAP
jgi:hypothetical protein